MSTVAPLLSVLLSFLFLGGDEERDMLVVRLKELHQKRDVLSVEVKERGRRLSSATPPSERESFEARVMLLNRFLIVENTVLDGFTLPSHWPALVAGRRQFR